MRFSVYRKKGTIFTLLGTTLYLEDSIKILENWNAGYIVSASGEMIVEKNL